MTDLTSSTPPSNKGSEIDELEQTADVNKSGMEPAVPATISTTADPVVGADDATHKSEEYTEDGNSLHALQTLQLQDECDDDEDYSGEKDKSAKSMMITEATKSAARQTRSSQTAIARKPDAGETCDDAIPLCERCQCARCVLRRSGRKKERQRCCCRSRERDVPDVEQLKPTLMTDVTSAEAKSRERPSTRHLNAKPSSITRRGPVEFTALTIGSRKTTRQPAKANGDGKEAVSENRRDKEEDRDKEERKKRKRSRSRERDRKRSRSPVKRRFVDNKLNAERSIRRIRPFVEQRLHGSANNFEGRLKNSIDWKAPDPRWFVEGGLLHPVLFGATIESAMYENARNILPDFLTREERALFADIILTYRMRYRNREVEALYDWCKVYYLTMPPNSKLLDRCQSEVKEYIVDIVQQHQRKILENRSKREAAGLPVDPLFIGPGNAANNQQAAVHTSDPRAVAETQWWPTQGTVGYDQNYGLYYGYHQQYNDAYYGGAGANFSSAQQPMYGSEFYGPAAHPPAAPATAVSIAEFYKQQLGPKPAVPHGVMC